MGKRLGLLIAEKGTQTTWNKMSPGKPMNIKKRTTKRESEL